MNEEKKVAFRLTAKQLTEVEKLKQKNFYNKSYSDLFRALVDAGIDAMKEKKKGE